MSIYRFAPDLKVNLEKYDIVTDGDILVVFEHIDDGSEGMVTFPTGFTGNRSLGRYASQAEWERLPARAPISIVAMVEK